MSGDTKLVRAGSMYEVESRDRREGKEDRDGKGDRSGMKGKEEH